MLKLSFYAKKSIDWLTFNTHFSKFLLWHINDHIMTYAFLHRYYWQRNNRRRNGGRRREVCLCEMYEGSRLWNWWETTFVAMFHMIYVKSINTWIQQTVNVSHNKNNILFRRTTFVNLIITCLRHRLTPKRLTKPTLFAYMKHDL